MKVVSLKLSGFMSYADITLRPPGGLTLVVGANGSGKSSGYVEGITWCLYGETVRGSTPMAGGECSVTLVAQIPPHGGVVGGTYEVTRTRKGKETKINFSDAVESLNGQTNTQTQARINAVFGSFERHVSSRVFSQEHVSRFAAATDKGRKALLEEALGLGRFDTAVGLLRNDLRAAQKDATTASTVEARAEGHLQACQERVDQLTAQPPLLAVAPEELEEVSRKLKEAKSEEAAAVAALEANRRAAAVEGAKRQALERKGGEHKARAHAWLAKLVALKEGPCPVCTQPVDPVHVRRHYEALAKPETDAVLETSKEMDVCDQVLVELMEEGNELGQARITARGVVIALEDEADRLEKAQLAADRHLRELVDAARSLTNAHQAYEERLRAARGARDRVQALEAAEAVLGLRGARTLLLGRGLSRLERGANAALAEMGVTHRVEVRGKTGQANGKEVDAVSVKVTGVGGGEYRGASRGERGLIDVALLIGNADLAGTGEGFQVYDEVMDGLDEQNAERLAGYLAGLAQGRQIIVVSHHAALKQQFPRAAVYEVVKVPGEFHGEWFSEVRGG